MKRFPVMLLMALVLLASVANANRMRIRTSQRVCVSGRCFEYTTLGNGVIVGNDNGDCIGITCAHCMPYTTKSTVSNGETLPVQVVYSDAKSDIAVYRFRSKTVVDSTPLRLGRVGLGTRVWFAPLHPTTNASPPMAGVVTQITDEGSYVIQIQGVTISGYSGSGIYTEDWSQVLGIAWGGSGNTVYAIPAGVFAPHLPTAAPAAPAAPDNSGILSRLDLLISATTQTQSQLASVDSTLKTRIQSIEQQQIKTTSDIGTVAAQLASLKTEVVEIANKVGAGVESDPKAPLFYVIKRNTSTGEESSQPVFRGEGFIFEVTPQK